MSKYILVSRQPRVSTAERARWADTRATEAERRALACPGDRALLLAARARRAEYYAIRDAASATAERQRLDDARRDARRSA